MQKRRHMCLVQMELISSPWRAITDAEKLEASRSRVSASASGDAASKTNVDEALFEQAPSQSGISQRTSHNSSGRPRLDGDEGL